MLQVDPSAHTYTYRRAERSRFCQASLMARRKIPHDRATTIGFGDALRDRDQPAGQLGLRRL